MNLRLLLLSVLTLHGSILPGAAAEHATQSRLAAGHWVKIRVTGEGIHQISAEQLREWGFDEPDRVRVYGYGGTALALERIGAGTDDIQPTLSTIAPDGRLLFYADADMRFDLRTTSATESTTSENGVHWRRNIYSSHGCYFLGYDDGTPMPEAVAAPDAPEEGETVYTGHMHVDATDRDNMSPISMGALFCDRDFTAADPYVIDIAFPDLTASETNTGATRQPLLTYSCYAAHGAGDIDSRQTTHTMRGALAQIQGLRHNCASPSRYNADDYISMSGSITFPATTDPAALQGSVAIGKPAAAARYTYLMDRYALVYPRLNRLRDGESQLIMQYATSVAGRAVCIADATPAQQLWDVSDPAAVRPLEMVLQPDGSALATMPENYARATPGRFILFDTAMQHPVPEYAGTVAPQNIHAAPTPELAIITTTALEPYARMLAEAHERVDGISTGIFLNEQVLNEFSSGVNTPMAYRRLARMLHDRDPQTLRHILLLGPARWDHRGITGAAATETIAIYECALPTGRASTTTAYASDVFVGCLDDFSFLDNHGAQMTVSVGRIPAETEAQAESMVTHIMDYIENPPDAGAFAQVLTASGSGDAYEHYLYAEELAQELENAGRGFVVKRLPQIAYASSNGKPVEAYNRLVENLAEGRGLFTYYGHSVGGLNIGGIYTTAIASSLNYNVAPLAILGTCQAFCVDLPYVTLAETMLGKRGGGAIATIAACRLVYSNLNHQLTQCLVKRYAEASPGTTIGDIFRDGMNDMLRAHPGTQARLNTKCYNLCGDPAVRLSIPYAAVRLTAIDGKEPGLEPVQGRRTLRLEGIVDGGDGTPDATFDGTARITVHDTSTDGTIINVSADAKEHPEIVFTNRTMAAATTTVSSGKWAAELFIPEFTNGGRDFSICVDADESGEGARRAAHGYFAQLPTAALPADLSGTDTAAPEIVRMYIDTPDFADGDIVASEFTLYATIHEPPTGINVNTAPLRNSSRVSLDGVTSASNIAGYITRSPDGTVEFAMPFGGLAEGRHTVTLEASNNAGETTERTLAFTVCADTPAAYIDVDESTARTQATLVVDHNLGDSADTRIIVEDATGHTVRQLHGSHVWELDDADGHPVPDGIYRAYALIRAGLRHCHTAAVEIVVVRAPQDAAQ